MKDEKYIKQLLLDDYARSVYDEVNAFYNYSCLPDEHARFLDENAAYKTSWGGMEGHLIVKYTSEITFNREDRGAWTIYMPIPNIDYSKSFFDNVEGVMTKNIETLSKFLSIPFPVMRDRIERLMTRSGEEASSFVLDLTTV